MVTAPGKLHELVDAIIALRCAHRFSITSWIRTREHNARVGGNPQSKHLLGLAVDVVPDEDVPRFLFLQSARTMGFHYLDEGDHIHLQMLGPGDVPREVLDFFQGHPVSPRMGGTIGGEPLPGPGGPPIQSERT